MLDQQPIPASVRPPEEQPSSQIGAAAAPGKHNSGAQRQLAHERQ